MSNTIYNQLYYVYIFFLKILSLINYNLRIKLITFFIYLLKLILHLNFNIVCYLLSDKLSKNYNIISSGKSATLNTQAGNTQASLVARIVDYIDSAPVSLVVSIAPEIDAHAYLYLERCQHLYHEAPLYLCHGALCLLSLEFALSLELEFVFSPFAF